MPPIYSYQCVPCGHDFDELVSMSEANDPQECPKCHGPSEKQVTVASLQFNGWFPGDRIKKTGKT